MACATPPARTPEYNLFKVFESFDRKRSYKPTLVVVYTQCLNTAGTIDG